MRETDGWTLVVILGMTAISIITRCFFFISEREWRLPGWAQRGLQYAPIAALAAVIAPDLVLTDGVIAHLLTDARTWGGLAVRFFVCDRPGGYAAGIQLDCEPFDTAIG